MWVGDGIREPQKRKANMWITIRTKRTNVSPRMRRNIEAFIRRTFHRERRQIASAVILLGPAKLRDGELGFTCQIRLWSSYLGMVSVADIGDTVRTAVQQASLRARHALRRRLHKRRSRTRRLAPGRLSRWLPDLSVE
jgi:hypothetical protein